MVARRNVNSLRRIGRVGSHPLYKSQRFNCIIEILYYGVLLRQLGKIDTAYLLLFRLNLRK